MGTQKNRLDETVFISTQNTCLDRWLMNKVQVYAKKMLIWACALYWTKTLENTYKEEVNMQSHTKLQIRKYILPKNYFLTQ